MSSTVASTVGDDEKAPTVVQTLKSDVDISVTNEEALANASAGRKVRSDISEISTTDDMRSVDTPTFPSLAVAASMAGAQEDPVVVENLKSELRYVLGNLEMRDCCANAREDLNSYSILAQVPLNRKMRIVEMAKQIERLDRAMGSICGMAVGDAMGHMFEFLPAQDEPRGSYFSLQKMKFYGKQNTFGLQLGQWTDDCSMGLCMADSLILKQEYDGSDMRARFWCWWNRGYNNAFRLDKSRRRSGSVGLGGNISKSLSAISRLRPGEKPPPIFQAQGDDAGNGSLMRFTPVALFFHAASSDQLHEFSRQSSYTTHPGIVAAEGCALLAHLINRAHRRPSGFPLTFSQGVGKQE
jgi:hypothetical protein